MSQSRTGYFALLAVLAIISIFLVTEYHIKFEIVQKRDWKYNANVSLKIETNIDTKATKINLTIAPSQSPSRVSGGNEYHDRNNYNTSAEEIPKIFSHEIPNTTNTRSTDTGNTGGIVLATPKPSSPLRKGQAYSILPKRVYSVIGLESSGTQFISRLLRDALHLDTYREGSFPFGDVLNEKQDVQVQHFSLPWGSTCQSQPHVPIVDVVLPSQCTKKENMYAQECARMGQDIWGKSTSFVNYPERYNLDIVSHKEWYDAQGVEQYFIIVVRDKSISHKARSRDHCTDQSLVRKEEEVGTDIIIDAINEYILTSDKTGKKVTRNNYDFWKASTFGGTNRRKLFSRRISEVECNSVLPNGNNVVLVSYETLMMLKEPYVKMLFEVLNIQSNYIPSIRDGNAKYVP